MRYEILGPLQVVDRDRVMSVGAPKVETLLALLLIHANQLVTIEQMLAECWTGTPPRRAVAGLHVYVSQLRKALREPAGRGGPILTRPPGYLLRVAPDQIDFVAFLRGCDAGRGRLRAGQPEQAVAYLSEALAHWRGPVPDHLQQGPALSPFAARLTEARLDCLEMLGEARLAAGRHREAVGPLRWLVLEHPLREPFYYQLMIALYRCQRQVEAVHVYQSARHNLGQELQLEPCRALQQLYLTILSGTDPVNNHFEGEHHATPGHLPAVAGRVPPA
jgi:DNA-binding SARP family transcriptional activator